jgi:hypothetical protein
MSISIDKVFEGLIHIDPFDKESLELLERMMTLDNPMRFDDDFASDEALDKLEHELERVDRRTPRANSFKKTIEGLGPCRTSGAVFI